MDHFDKLAQELEYLIQNPNWDYETWILCNGKEQPIIEHDD